MGWGGTKSPRTGQLKVVIVASLTFSRRPEKVVEGGHSRRPLRRRDRVGDAGLFAAQCRASHRRNRGAGSQRSGARRRGDSIGPATIGRAEESPSRKSNRRNYFFWSSSPKFEQPPQGFQQKGSQSVLWTAHDDNEDDLRYTVLYRAENEKEWKVLKDKLGRKVLHVGRDFPARWGLLSADRRERCAVESDGRCADDIAGQRAFRHRQYAADDRTA